MVESAKLRRLSSSSIDGSQGVPPLRHKLAQITSTLGSATRECVRRKAASFKSAFRRFCYRLRVDYGQIGFLFGRWRWRVASLRNVAGDLKSVWTDNDPTSTKV